MLFTLPPFLGVFTSSFTPFGRWGRVTHAGNWKALNKTAVLTPADLWQRCSQKYKNLESWICISLSQTWAKHSNNQKLVKITTSKGPLETLFPYASTKIFSAESLKACIYQRPYFDERPVTLFGMTCTRRRRSNRPRIPVANYTLPRLVKIMDTGVIRSL